MRSRTSQRRLHLRARHSILLQERTQLAKFCLRDKRQICHGYDELHHVFIACSWWRVCKFERTKVRKRMPRAVSVWSWRIFWEQRNTNITRRNVQALLPTISTSIHEGRFFTGSKTHAQPQVSFKWACMSAKTSAFDSTVGKKMAEISMTAWESGYFSRSWKTRWRRGW